MKVAIVTEAGRGVGFGHLARCISIYDALVEKGCEPHFFIASDVTLSKLLINRSFDICDWPKDNNKLLSKISNFDLLIIDSYLMSNDLYTKCSERVKVCAYLDDTNRLLYPKGIVINGLMSAELLSYPDRESIDYLIGSQYLYLRNEFVNSPKRTINNDIKNVFICLGGDDIRCLLPNILNKVFAELTGVCCYVATGFDARHIEDTKNEFKDSIKWMVNVSAEVMKEAMDECDVAIISGGQIVTECARMGLPSFVINVIDNQDLNIKAWMSTRFIDTSSDWDNKLLLDEIGCFLTEKASSGYRQKKSDLGRKLVDGKGSVRLVKHMLKVYYSKNLTLRDANNDDVKDVYDLSNDPLVRDNSSNTNVIQWDKHIQWMSQKLKEKDHYFYILEVDDGFVGQVRFDCNKSNVAVISISVDSQLRGLGLGAHIISLAIERFNENNKRVDCIEAIVKQENAPSIKSFEKAGFKCVGKKDVNNVLSQVLHFTLKR